MPRRKKNTIKTPIEMPGLIVSSANLETENIENKKQQQKKIQPIKKNKGKLKKSTPAKDALLELKERENSLIIKPENAAAKRLMWFSATLFSLMIIILWGWAMKVRLDNLSIKQTPETKLIKQGQQDWDTLFNQTNENQQQTTTLSNIKKYLQQIVDTASNSTSSASSAVVTTTAETTTTAKTKNVKY